MAQSNGHLYVVMYILEICKIHLKLSLEVVQACPMFHTGTDSNTLNYGLSNTEVKDIRSFILENHCMVWFPH